MNDLSASERVLGGLWGAVVGDSLGVPVEFLSRELLDGKPVRDMQGYGTYDQPPGTWSDDSSLMVCTVETLLEGFDTGNLGNSFVRWLHKAYWTPWGQVFDVGGTTRQAINNLSRGGDPEVAGLIDEASNGNGSLMRILPVGLRYFRSSTDRLLDYSHRASSLTHRHPRSQMACGIYSVMVAALVNGCSKSDAYRHAIGKTKPFYQQAPYRKELSKFRRLFSGEILKISEPDIESSGYVIHTLEASIWCLFNSESFQEAVLMAVNLGEDTDTTATVTGGLAGILYGVDSIPANWQEQLARREDLTQLFEAFAIEALR